MAWEKKMLQDKTAVHLEINTKTKYDQQGPRGTFS